MFQTLRAARAARRARSAYEAAHLQLLIEENEQHLARLRSYDKCRWCEAMETPEQREVCESQFARTDG